MLRYLSTRIHSTSEIRKTLDSIIVGIVIDSYCNEDYIRNIRYIIPYAPGSYTIAYCIGNVQ